MHARSILRFGVVLHLVEDRKDRDIYRFIGPRFVVGDGGHNSTGFNGRFRYLVRGNVLNYGRDVFCKSVILGAGSLPSQPSSGADNRWLVRAIST